MNDPVNFPMHVEYFVYCLWFMLERSFTFGTMALSTNLLSSGKTGRDNGTDGNNGSHGKIEASQG
ncbi:MAG: hypothetical protein AAB401_14395, partial [Acidobacteriota bacterium]